MIITIAIFLVVYLHQKLLDAIYTKTTKQKGDDTELQELIGRRKDINSTIETFNNPSTFAKYSKMQRELNKLEEAIERLKAQSLPTVSERQMPLGRRKANIIFIALVLFVSSMFSVGRVNPEDVGFPLSLLVGREGEINGVMVAIVSKLVLMV